MFFKKIKYGILFFVLLAGWFIFYSAKAQQAPENYVPNQLLVKLKNQDRIYKVVYPEPIDIVETKKVISQMDNIEMVEPNYLFRATYLTNDPLSIEQWYLNKIQTPAAWDLTKGGSAEITVAVLDTGVDINHPDLKDNIWINRKEISNNGVDDDQNNYVDDYYGWDFVKNIPDPSPKFEPPYASGPINHGTVVAGIIASAGDNQQGTVGIAWKSKIMVLRVLDSQGIGSVESVIRAVNYAKNNGAKIVNLSFVGTSRSELLAQSLKEAWRAGLIIVAAAGNEATGKTEDLDQVPSYPVCLDAGDADNYIIGVAATDQNDRRASFSNYGSRCIDISAPGTRIYGPLVQHSSLPGYDEPYGGYWSGTSVAVPMVSATVALVEAANPLLTNQQVVEAVLSQTDNIDGINPNFIGKIGRGRLDVYRAVQYVYDQITKAPQPRYIVTAAGPGGGPHIRIMKSNGMSVGGFMAYDTRFRGGVRVATGDVDGDGQEEIIAGPASLGAAQIKIFDIKGNLKNDFLALKNYNQGVNLTACDLDNNGTDEIIVSSNGGTEPAINVFNQDGQLVHKFLAYNKSFRAELKIACGDVDGDGDKEIVVAPGLGNAPVVKIFSPNGELETQWSAFLNKFRGGVNLAIGDVDGDNQLEIITSVASGASPYIRVFDYFGFLQIQFLAYEGNSFSGTTIAAADLNNDGEAEIISGPGRGASPQINIFNYLGVNRGTLSAYDRRFMGGVYLSSIKGN